MKTYELEGWKIEVDVERTQATYALIEKGGCEQCGCSSCRNFLSTAQSSLPAELFEFMRASQISISKDAEIYNFGTVENKLVRYAGGYYLWGKVITKPSSNSGFIQETKIEFVDPTPLAQKDFQSPNAIGLYLESLLPWILDELTPEELK